MVATGGDLPGAAGDWAGVLDERLNRTGVELHETVGHDSPGSTDEADPPCWAPGTWSTADCPCYGGIAQGPGVLTDKVRLLERGHRPVGQC